MSSLPSPPAAPLTAGWRAHALAALAWRHRCIDAAEQAQARAGDAWLLTPRGLWAWGIALIDGVLLGLWLADLLTAPRWFALAVCVLAALAMMLALVQAWFRPHATLAKWRANIVVSWAILGGVALVQWQGGSHNELWRVLLWLLPAAGLTVMQAALAQWGRTHAEREMRELRLQQERDAAARQAAEARLAMLQAQIQPHFIFNTLAALQHWVDSGDARAAPLLRDLTGFLRGSTELMARDEVALADELLLARHYLAIMQARLGERLNIEIDATEAALAQRLPPGLLLTLVENAIEHGVAPLLRAGRVRISARRDAAHFALAVQDSGPGLATGWREGIGLANLRERLARRFGERARFTLRDNQPGTQAEIRIEDDIEDESA